MVRRSISLVVAVSLCLGLLACYSDEPAASAAAPEERGSITPVDSAASNDDESQAAGANSDRRTGPYYGITSDVLDENGIVEVYSDKNTEGPLLTTLENGIRLKLTATLPFGWFRCVLPDGRAGYIDARNVYTETIPPHGYSHEQPGYVLVFTHADQTLRIYKDGVLVEESLASSGVRELYTPRGVFQIEAGRRGEWWYDYNLEMGIKYWVGFKGIWLFHSIPHSLDRRILVEEAAKLGSPASHGCIRLPVEVAQFIFEKVPAGSMVLID